MIVRELSARGPRAQTVERRVWLVLTCALSLTAQSARAQDQGEASRVIAATELRPSVSARSSTVQPKPNAQHEAKNEREAQLDTAGQKLNAANGELVQQGLGELALMGGKDAAQLVIARLRRGLPPQLIDASIDALTRLKDPSAIPLLLELATHRRYQVRSHAVDALGTLGAKNAEAVLLYALDDPSADVREAAVRSLGKVGSRRALKPLFAAGERGLSGALGAVGSIGGSAEAELLITRAKTGQVDALSGLSAMLLRTNVPFPTKSKIVSTLSELGTQPAKDCLTQSLNALGDKGDARVRSLLGQALGLTAPSPAQAKTQAPAAAKTSEVAK
jgi:HEAT repeat protein